MSMNQEMTVENFRRCFQGHVLTDCSVRDKDFLYFLAVEDYSLWPPERWDPDEDLPPPATDLFWHIIVYARASEPGKRWTRERYRGFEQLISGAARSPQSKHVSVSWAGDVHSIGSGSKGIEPKIANWREGGALRGSVNKLRSIDGWLYFCGGNNSVGKRLGPGEWFSHTQAIADPAREDHLSNDLFDIDGFNERDIYTVGSDGQVFQFDGVRWERVAFPTNVDLINVCCGGDGEVYIADKRGIVYRGRGERWERLGKGGLSASLRDLVWYEGQLWGSNEYGVWTLADEGLERATLPAGFAAYAGNLSAADGLLLLAGRNGAAMLENGEWTVLYSAAEMSRLARSPVQ